MGRSSHLGSQYHLAEQLQRLQPAGEGTQWNIVNKVVRVPYVGVDKANMDQFK